MQVYILSNCFHLTSLFKVVTLWSSHKGQSLKNLPSLVGPLLPREALHARKMESIFVRQESVTQGLGLNQIDMVEESGGLMAKVVMTVFFC